MLFYFDKNVDNVLYEETFLMLWITLDKVHAVYGLFSLILLKIVYMMDYLEKGSCLVYPFSMKLSITLNAQ